MILAFIGCIIVFAVSCAKESGHDVYAKIDTSLKKTGYGFAVIALLMLVLISFVFMSSAGGFLYANF